MAHKAELKAANDTVAGEFNARRASVEQMIDAEFAYKIAAAVMVAPPEMHAAIISALRSEQAAKTAQAMRSIGAEQKAARIAVLAAIRGRQRQERKKVAADAVPTRPRGKKRSSHAYGQLRST